MNSEIKTPKHVIKLAKDMRDNPTYTETILWERLRKRQLGAKFRQQHPVYRYILDFYCHEKKLAIEIDGDVHNQQREYDLYRDDFLNSIGIRTIRFRSEEILENTDRVIGMIEDELR